MQLSSLDIALQRINTIEGRIQSLTSFAKAPDADFQKILDSSVQKSKNPTSVSRSEIDNLISKYADKNGLDEDFVKTLYDISNQKNADIVACCTKRFATYPEKEDNKEIILKEYTTKESIENTYKTAEMEFIIAFIL